MSGVKYYMKNIYKVKFEYSLNAEITENAKNIIIDLKKNKYL
jgi:hypothetical protein